MLSGDCQLAASKTPPNMASPPRYIKKQTYVEDYMAWGCYSGLVKLIFDDRFLPVTSLVKRRIHHV
jgi:hypothetical protein